MFTSNLIEVRSMNMIKLYMTVMIILVTLFLYNSLYAQSDKNNVSSAPKSNSSDNMQIIAKSNKSDQQQIKDKKQEKEDKALEQAGKKAKVKENSNSSEKADEQNTKKIESQKAVGESTKKIEPQKEQPSNSSRTNSNVKPSTSVPEKQNNSINNKTRVEPKTEVNTPVPETKDNKTKIQSDQNQRPHVISPKPLDRVQQSNQGTLVPDAIVQHHDENVSPHAHGVQIPDDHGYNWYENHGNHNHEHIVSGGYYHDYNQHDFGRRRHDWHDRYPFFSFRLGFNEDYSFPHNYLYYYPTDYVIVDSRLSIVVLPFTDENDNTHFDSNLADNLIAALTDLHRFNIISSRTVNLIMSRNDINENDLTDQYSAKSLGKYAGADMVLMSSIDETSDHFTLTIQGIDPITGETIITETATSDYTDSDSIDRLVKYLAVLIYNDLPLAEGTITDINGEEVDVNIGSDDGLLLGTRCVVYREGVAVRHPYTGEYLGQKIYKVGEVYIDNLLPNNSTARFISRNGRFHVGDKIIVK